MKQRRDRARIRSLAAQRYSKARRWIENADQGFRRAVAPESTTIYKNARKSVAMANSRGFPIKERRAVGSERKRLIFTRSISRDGTRGLVGCP